MSLLQQDKNPLELELGRVLRIPSKFIRGSSSAHSSLIQNISQQLQATGKNILPVIVKALGEDDYQVTLNAQILEAARQAGLDFVWCIVVDDQMQAQVELEAGSPSERTEPKAQLLNILTASERDLIKVLEHIKIKKPGCNKIKPKEAAQAIIEQRSKKLTSLKFLTKQRCGIGDATVPKLKEFMFIG